MENVLLRKPIQVSSMTLIISLFSKKLNVNDKFNIRLQVSKITVDVILLGNNLFEKEDGNAQRFQNVQTDKLVEFHLKFLLTLP